MQPQADSTWEYQAHSKGQLPTGTKEEEEETEDLTLSELQMIVPLVSGEAAVIEQLMHSEAVKNLGLYARPDGNNKPHLKQVRDRVEELMSLINNRELFTRSV